MPLFHTGCVCCVVAPYRSARPVLSKPSIWVRSESWTPIAATRCWACDHAGAIWSIRRLPRPIFPRSRRSIRRLDGAAAISPISTTVWAPPFTIVWTDGVLAGSVDDLAKTASPTSQTIAPMRRRVKIVTRIPDRRPGRRDRRYCTRGYQSLHGTSRTKAAPGLPATPERLQSGTSARWIAGYCR